MLSLPTDLSEDALLAIAQNHFGPSSMSAASFDDLGSTLRDPDALGSGKLECWDDLKQEFHSLLCTDDDKYKDLREKFGGLGKKSEASLIGLLSAAMAPFIGVTAAALGPFCALCLIAAVRLGKESFCRSWPLDEAVGVAAGQPKQY